MIRLEFIKSMITYLHFVPTRINNKTVLYHRFLLMLFEFITYLFYYCEWPNKNNKKTNVLCIQSNNIFEKTNCSDFNRITCLIDFKIQE